MGRGDINNVDVGVVCEFFIAWVSVRNAEGLGEFFCGLGCSGANGDKFGLREKLECFGKFSRDSSCAEYAPSNFCFHCYLR